MKVTKAEIVISAVQPEQYPTLQVPEVALIGRSNVGKSSFINTLIHRKNLARTSSQPGKTQTLNFYLINEMMHFVDLPGYGYAKVSKSKREEWGNMIETYLTTREQLRTVFHVIDLRHPPSKNDILMYEWLCHFDIPHEVIATKQDKLPKTHVPRHAKVIREELGMPKGKHPILFSSETGLGKEEVWKVIYSACDIRPNLDV
ncbi:YihA family ribosome biogenesis GTP-binding protein [Desulfuribacillus stibiiarsenatis]|uniref:Probable GTP-binding protein EngB n=1 Tax=Desulfuribacillus stibiiarsenatis TaxID=1390249 RepID=A0A1E5L2C7_9FIRM|nr:ribosome biogenesis GTP-binding protein YihA/YsxC [Desulfuribacillus stibiiarsenatis]OEH84183.1 YihA family ribosome biogenesis GTP-binding protein [Desulfuribacillus stibiiarsenatis]